MTRFNRYLSIIGRTNSAYFITGGMYYQPITSTSTPITSTPITSIKTPISTLSKSSVSFLDQCEKKKFRPDYLNYLKILNNSTPMKRSFQIYRPSHQIENFSINGLENCQNIRTELEELYPMTYGLKVDFPSKSSFTPNFLIYLHLKKYPTTLQQIHGYELPLDYIDYRISFTPDGKIHVETTSP